MAPNRRAKNDHHGGGGGGGGGGGPAHPHLHNNQRHGQNGGHGHEGMATMPLKCVRPKGCLEPKRLIYKEDIDSGAIEVVRLTCNNLQCEQGNYMHVECFMDWELTVLNFLSSTGRARSWSVKQRQQNLWTKKGYDLAFKACDCNCGKGHLRKDLDWISPREKINNARVQNQAAVAAAPAPHREAPAAVAAPPAHEEPAAAHQQNQQAAQNQAAAVAAEEKRKKKRKTKEILPTLALSAPVPHPNDNHSRKATTSNTTSAPKLVSASSTSSSEGGCSGSGSGSSGIGSFESDHSAFPSLPSSSGPWNVPESLYRPRVNSLSSNASGSSGAFSGSSGSPPSPDAQFGSPVSTGAILAQNIFKFQRKNSSASSHGGGGDRIRHNSTGSVFCRRNDFSSFNFLPKQRQNSYHIKMDDDGQGNDDLRFTVLATLQNQRMTKVNCCMCQTGLTIYDRYPLIDGTFFVSPRQYFKDSIMMSSTEGNPARYMSTLCMHCLSGKNGGFVCRGCGKAWDGTTIVLGGCYNYDIFAAATCCAKKVQCGNCRLVPTEKAPQFFSDASRLTRCFRCGFTDFHFAKSLEMVYERYPPDQFQKILQRQKLEESLRVLPALQGPPYNHSHPQMQTLRGYEEVA